MIERKIIYLFDFRRIGHGKIYPVISPDANIPGAIIASDGMDDNYNLKISSESYEVFVNNDKVGNKILLTQTDNPEDLNDFLKIMVLKIIN